MSYKEWTQRRAGELAEEWYGLDFYDLTPKQQDEVYSHTQEDCKDHLANQIDATREGK